MFILILESIGMAELFVIGLVALIFFGPRKLPEFARTLGKWRAELKKTTDEFRNTWEREVATEMDQFKNEIEKIGHETTDLNILTEDFNSAENSKANEKNEEKPNEPEIREVSQEDLKKLLAAKTERKIEDSEISEEIEDKRTWL